MYGRSARVGALALFLITSVAACESPNRTTPASLVDLSQRRAQATEKISSTCGTAVSVDTSGQVKCQFDERNYSGSFSISDEKLASGGIASVSPKTGTSATTFVVSAGKKSGFGDFSVTDANKNTISVGV